ncbi:O-antigen ligase family protein [Oceanirhabdus sp. W0125-5]|uniref:O-antigen ligase family protein n=1 Tax=Oceanirhabdus sp. W0125-5 TaxID=2999116 RepID=UPI0022F2F028|nr:O-antigen ligase family protein [Oceanirhabdus sp. W0125-5]WBW99444.1 O-antigen ligase family protein [Oceanirhabdus sp. W0125-5]
MLELLKEKSAYIITALLIIIGFITNPELYYVYLFCIVLLGLIYKKFNGDLRKNYYYVTLMLALTGYNLKVPLGNRFGIYYFTIILFSYFVILLLDIISKKENIDFRALLKNKYALFLIIFIVYMIVSILWSENKKFSIISIYNYANMIGFLIMVIVENKSREELGKTTRLLIAIYTGMLILGLLQILNIDLGIRNCYREIKDLNLNDPIYSYLKRIPTVFFYNPNNYAFVLGVALIFIFPLIIFSKDKKERVFLIILYIMSTIQIIFTRCRTAWITVFIVLGVLLLIALIIKNKKCIVHCLVFITISWGTIYGLSFIPQMSPFYGKIDRTPIINNNKYNEKVEMGSKNSMSRRYTLMYDVVKGVILEKNIHGFGAGNIGNYILKQNNTYGTIAVHCLWLEILGDFGIFILFYFIFICISLFVSLFINAYKLGLNRCNYGALGAGISIALLVFAPSSVTAFIPFWLSLALIYSIYENRKALGE